MNLRLNYEINLRRNFVTGQWTVECGHWKVDKTRKFTIDTNHCSVTDNRSQLLSVIVSYLLLLLSLLSQ